ncbi:hypothetical protein H0G86_001588 [Trichoderma simmonsii]|uniref:Fungal death-pathway protein SesB domain-containing protein n=1 Tax=Trichoderma simmonsii TaxID=1491479 RepID=A0A8G0PF36_9HYPO|nr:hypothetical protein H0G86_001588 [Trichoderma simmonsii]
MSVTVDPKKKVTVELLRDLADAKVDIVFVHGLHDDTWKAENGFCWPETLLPAKAPHARILSLKYPVDSVFFNGEGNLLRTSSRLINKLTDLRKDEQSKSRPAIFVAHCLGGMVLENALVNASKDDEQKALIPCVRGVLLLGSPHFAAGAEGLKAVKNYYRYFRGADASVPNDDDLREELQHLATIPQAFQALQTSSESKFEVKSFYASEGDVIVGKTLAKWSEKSSPQSLGRSHLQLSQYEDESDDDLEDVLRILIRWLSQIDQASGPREQTGSGDVSNATFSGSHNSGMQLGQNTGNSTFSWGNGK